jgi:hypothetical protein
MLARSEKRKELEGDATSPTSPLVATALIPRLSLYPIAEGSDKGAHPQSPKSNSSSEPFAARKADICSNGTG